MILLLDRLKDNVNFSDAEEKIASYVLENPLKVTQMTIHELSKETFASAATITRFCRKVKTQGFGEFKIQLARELNIYNLEKGRIEDDLPFSEAASHQDIAHTILNLNFQAMMDTYNHIDIDQLVRIARLLSEANSISLFGTGQSLILCHDFQYKLFRIGIDCSVEGLSGFQLMKSQSQPKDSVSVIISYYGQGKQNLNIIKTLHARNIPTVLLTGPNKNPLCAYAHEVVHVPPQEELIKKMASFSSRAAIQLILDIIYSLIFSFDYEENRRKLSEISSK